MDSLHWTLALASVFCVCHVFSFAHVCSVTPWCLQLPTKTCEIYSQVKWSRSQVTNTDGALQVQDPQGKWLDVPPTNGLVAFDARSDPKKVMFSFQTLA